MKKRERQEYIKQETQAVFDELSIYLEQLILLKPFIANLIAVANDAEPIYDLSCYIKNTQKK